MCGISALVGKNVIDHSSSIESMTRLIAHRGPDGEGFFRSNNVLLGHRRLSILDLSSGGSQPMAFQDRYLITYNGEIYNYVEIRAELLQAGYTFHSTSDTEVILAAYDKWGTDCHKRFNGMWAFVIYDKERQKIFASRDRFGVKPLYFWISPSRNFLAFASEIKQFTCLPEWEAQLNPGRVCDFLRWGILDHSDETMFGNVFQIRGGHSLELSTRDSDLSSLSLEELNKSISRWYEMTERKLSKSFGLAAKEFLNVFKNAVRLRMRADVVVGSCLSGGLDSSSIVSVMSDLRKESGSTNAQKTFSACSSHKKYDEKKFIDVVVESSQVEAHYVYPDDKDLISIFEKITWHQDEPFGSTSIFAQWKVFELARHHGVKVMLDGQGADEQLMGYHTFFTSYWTELFKKMRWIQLAKELKSAKERHGLGILRSLKRLAFYVLPKAIALPLRNLLVKHENFDRWLNTQKINVDADSPFESSGYFSDVSMMSKIQLFQTSVPMLLHWEDRDSMAHGVESRVPFLDYNVVETSLGLPSSFKLNEGVTKRVLRQAMIGVLPEVVRMRMDKMGFVTPEEVWMKQNPKVFRSLLEEAVRLSGGLVKAEILEFYDKMTEGHLPFDFMYWRVMSFGCWLKVFKIRMQA